MVGMAKTKAKEGTMALLLFASISPYVSLDLLSLSGSSSVVVLVQSLTLGTREGKGGRWMASSQRVYGAWGAKKLSANVVS